MPEPVILESLLAFATRVASLEHLFVLSGTLPLGATGFAQILIPNLMAGPASDDLILMSGTKPDDWV